MRLRFTMLSVVVGAALLVGCGSSPTAQDDKFFSGLQDAHEKVQNGTLKFAPKAGPRNVGDVLAKHNAQLAAGGGQPAAGSTGTATTGK
jgi:hypothetical protein